MVLSVRLDDLRQPGRARAVERAPPACLLRHRARRLHLLGLAFFSWSNVSAQAILYYIVTYGLTTIGAFGVVGVVERATGSDKLDAFLGLHKRNPLLAAVLLVLFLSLAGIPPLVGFWAKFNLFAAVLNGGWSGFMKGPLSSLPPSHSPSSLSPSPSAPSRSTTICRCSSAPTSCPPATRRPSTRIPSRSPCCSPSPPRLSSSAASRRCCKLDRQLLSSDVANPRGSALATHKYRRSPDPHIEARRGNEKPANPPPQTSRLDKAARSSSLRPAR